MVKIEGGITVAQGFESMGVEALVKYKDRKDMALIYSQVPCVCAGVFTTNQVQAAPVIWDKHIVDNSPYAQAIVVNSGIANACTGKQGLAYCQEEASLVAQLLDMPKEAVLVASTGVIGMQLNMDKIKAGIKQLVEVKEHSLKAGHEAAQAIMTTDTIPKEYAVEILIDGVKVTIGGMCKGSGMIHPNMCTMLGFITTDVAISKELLMEALKEDVQDTFNMISVDGDTSTNDSLIVLANGMAKNPMITEKNEVYNEFLKGLHEVNESLAKMMAGDGEGATALFEVKVEGAKSKEDARILSKAVICSSLTKAAIFGHDANWGRILCALGYSGATFDPENVDLYFQSESGKIQIYGQGVATDYSEEEATKILSAKEVTVIAQMNMGQEKATAWGCDLSYDYVKINADYRS